MTLINGDALVFLQTLKDESIDLILTDPPYGTTMLAFDINIPDPKRYMKEFERILKPGGTAAIFCAGRFMFSLYAAAPKLFRYDLIWEKASAVGFLDAKRRQLRAHENIFIFSKKKDTVYNPQMREGKPYKNKAHTMGDKLGVYGILNGCINPNNTGTRHPRSVICDIKHSNNKSHHPTAKPVALMKELVLTYSNKGDLVLDPFMGAGSSALACAQTDRKYIGVEIDKHYFETAKSRYNEQIKEKILVGIGDE